MIVLIARKDFFFIQFIRFYSYYYKWSLILFVIANLEFERFKNAKFKQ